MPIRRYKPTSAGRRFMSVSTFEEITKSEPEKSLLAPLSKKGGRNRVTPFAPDGRPPGDDGAPKSG